MISSNADKSSQRSGSVNLSNNNAVPNSAGVSTQPLGARGGNIPPALMSRNIQLPPPVMEQLSGKFVS